MYWDNRTKKLMTREEWQCEKFRRRKEVLTCPDEFPKGVEQASFTCDCKNCARCSEVRQKQEQVRQAQQNLDYADSEYIDKAIIDYSNAHGRFNNYIKEWRR